ncbi:hypothetical protein DFA_00411 [Cavenderia fasciculata]|uniref:Monalysin Pore-forming domain-containing protein n=1 Tax=Cavenderia fasciculata TaxID=261658 RepID=F4PRQ1_CACFS|nr:uncharacterized protein DFA_00411 [Cavenderia fasciculata]EGG20550.1 hypothetical protein DFA_00411 [Cavenderia fasciculata]|eukprot:XP_004358400.1 hypothetical protein DFA_00411 [Cavenderia fasciculata]
MADVEKHIHRALETLPAGKDTRVGGSFDMNNAKIVNSNGQATDAVTKPQNGNPPHPCCLVGVNYRPSSIQGLTYNGNTVTFNADMKPAIVYTKYIEGKEVYAPTVHPSDKYKGFTREYTPSNQNVRVSVSNAIDDCEKALQIGNLYNYTVIMNEEKGSWNASLQPGKWVIYQTHIYYAWRITVSNETPLQYIKDVLNANNYPFRVNAHDPQYVYGISVVNRNDNFVLAFDTRAKEPVTYNQVTDYMFGAGYSRWSGSF